MIHVSAYSAISLKEYETDQSSYDRAAPEIRNSRPTSGQAEAS
jgi:hypothetical protein